MNNNQGPPYYGKYRGTVSANRDPLLMGRLRARVPDIFGDEETGWALPAAPYAGDGVGFFMIPPERASVWIEFEAGDPERPIWSGCFWAMGEVPASPATPEMKVIKTEAATVTLNDLPGAGGVTIETTNGMKITIDATKIEIDNGLNAKVTLSGPTVSVNGNALEVT